MKRYGVCFLFVMLVLTSEVYASEAVSPNVSASFVSPAQYAEFSSSDAGFLSISFGEDGRREVKFLQLLKVAPGKFNLGLSLQDHTYENAVTHSVEAAIVSSVNFSDWLSYGVDISLMSDAFEMSHGLTCRAEHYRLGILHSRLEYAENGRFNSESLSFYASQSFEWWSIGGQISAVFDDEKHLSRRWKMFSRLEIERNSSLEISVQKGESKKFGSTLYWEKHLSQVLRFGAGISHLPDRQGSWANRVYGLAGYAL